MIIWQNNTNKKNVKDRPLLGLGEVSCLQGSNAIDRIIRHLKLTFASERPPPPHIAHQELLMAKDIIAMSLREIDRFRIVQGVIQMDLTQVKAAEVLGITDRHIRRLLRRVREKGARGIVHRSRGRASPNRMLKELEERIAGVVEEKYTGFGPTLASEKLFERDGIRISKEKLRQIMMVHGLWQRKRRRRAIHPWRERKDYFGEMVQMDGSHHAWLEGRGPRFVLMGYVDDAKNNFFGHFYGYEGVYPAMDSLERYISLYGLPRSLYLDKHSTHIQDDQRAIDG